MNEIDILDIFYDKLREEGQNRTTLFLSIDESTIAELKQKKGVEFPLEDIYKLADICIANEWLERTTADPNYKYLSLTSAGLEIAIANQYQSKRSDHHRRKDDK